jgi:DNA-binding XRE family transcriptional regulator
MKKTIDRNNLNWSKIEKLSTTNDMLDNLYGKEGSVERELFKKEAYSYYTGQIIEQARKEAKMTQSELAEKVGSNKSYISRIETGRTEPKVSTFYRIASALGRSVELTPAL